jgi:hypothetical protein
MSEHTPDAPDNRAHTFKAKWGPGGSHFEENERQGAQAYFLDLCRLLGVPDPGSAPDYIFEKQTASTGQARGFADVFKRDHFAWENKAPGKNLDTALKQLLGYSLALANPPLLVVCDRLSIRIHTQFNGHPSETHTVTLEQLAEPEKRTLLRRLWTDPESFRPKQTSRDITEQAAHSFATLAELIRKRGHHPDKVAHFLTQCLFCFFAEDVGLLPGRMFERLVANRHLNSERLTAGLQTLFETMRGGGLYGADDIPWFNGGLFKIIDVPKLEILDITELRNAANLNWSAIDVSIFGTLFERGLDPAKRSQLGAHYTDPATIQRLIDPVLRRQLLQMWEQTNEEIRRLLAQSTKYADKNYKAAHAAFITWLGKLRDYRVLDPACGSGNFLFLGLKALKDIEHQSHIQAAALGLDRETDLVTGPHNVLGIELNEYAAELARVTVWIGELQWRLAHGYEFKTNPVLEPLDHIECRDALLVWATAAETAEMGVRPEFRTEASTATNHGGRNSALTPISAVSAEPTPTKQATEAPWPRASVVIGNPPFLGGSKKRRELGDAYFEALDTVFKGRVPGGADLVCYWFEKARKAIETNGLGAAGLVATNSIRGGANRKVLDAIVKSSNIFAAWSDEGWVNEGAAVRVSLVCLGHAAGAFLNGTQVDQIHSDLTATNSGATVVDLATAKQLKANAGVVFEGLRKDGPLDIPGETAREWLRLPNPHGKSNAVVLYPLINGIDVTRRPRDGWVIDTGEAMTEQEAALFEAPFAHIVRAVKPVRLQNNDRIRRTFWWRFGRNGEQLRAALKPLGRYINTPRVAKHRLFVWQAMPSIPDTATVAVARADDTTFGILHSRFHELWSLRMGTWLGVGNDPRYTPTTCFETFPFPTGLTPADTAHQRTEGIEGGALIPAGLSEQKQPLAGVSTAQAATKTVAIKEAATQIAQAAKRLDDLRQAWLNPPEWTHKVPEVTPLGMSTSPYPDRVLPRDNLSEADAKALQKRTLTNLYNQRPAWLTAAHQALDAAVAAAYNWPDYTPAMPDTEILARLLALNLARSAKT